jgi:hypothetical protein
VCGSMSATLPHPKKGSLQRAQVDRIEDDTGAIDVRSLQEGDAANRLAARTLRSLMNTLMI